MADVYNKIQLLEGRMTSIESTRPYLQDLIERNISSQEKLSETMCSIQQAIIEMNTKIDTHGVKIQNIQEDFEKMRHNSAEQLETVKKKVNHLEDKGKFDMILFFRQYFPWIIVVLGLGISLLSQTVKF